MQHIQSLGHIVYLHVQRLNSCFGRRHSLMYVFSLQPLVDGCTAEEFNSCRACGLAATFGLCHCAGFIHVAEFWIKWQLVQAESGVHQLSASCVHRPASCCYRQHKALNCRLLNCVWSRLTLSCNRLALPVYGIVCQSLECHGNLSEFWPKAWQWLT